MTDLPPSSLSPWREPPRYSRSDPPPGKTDVCVVGAGIAGIATASMLAERGFRVTILDNRFPGAGTTGRSSAKVSVLHQHNAQQIAERRSRRDAELYIAANQWGFGWVAGQVEELADCGWERRPAITYATDDSGEAAISRERDLLVGCGLDARIETLEMPWGSHDAVVLADQAQFDPQRFIDGMVDKLRGRGASFHHPVRVTGVDDQGDHIELETSAGSVTADHVVIATGLPFLDRGLHFARADPRTSHVVGVRVRDLPPAGMYISAGSPVRSVRTAVDGSGEPLVLVGGEGHRTGTTSDTLERQRTLADWAARTFDVVEITHRFSAEDYTTPDLVPFAGPIRPGSNRIHVLTGMNKWGFTNSPAAAAAVVGHIDDSEPVAWSDLYSATRLPVTGLDELAKTTFKVGRYAVTGWAKSIAENPTRPGQPIGSGPERPCAASGVCTHLGGIVRWNDAAGTWDCPLHGSRFGSDGSMVHGPATRDLLRSGSQPAPE